VVTAPGTAAVVRSALDEAFAAAASRSTSIAVLDAGCGRVSALKAYRPRIARFVGADIHAPVPGSLPHLDEFREVDLCGPADAFAPGSFDVILSSFTLERFSDPVAAVRNMRGWLRPGGRLVITTVNRRNPLVRAYLDLPDGVRRRVQPLVKATAADAHPLVGACNDPAAVEAALRQAGFEMIEITTTAHLATAWGRRRLPRLLGGLGDALTAHYPSRRSTIVAHAIAPTGA